MLLVAIENLVAGLAGDAELPADLAHGFPIQTPDNKRRRSSITKLAFHGIHTSLCPVRFVTYVSGRSDELRRGDGLVRDQG